MSILRIYTDGGCSNNQSSENIGGWGCVLEYGIHTRELHGGEFNTTNNRMELTAVIEALKALKKDNNRIEIFTDSSYVANCFRDKWYIGWEARGWVNSKKQPVENRDLWEELLSLFKANECTFYRVHGHINLNTKPVSEICADFIKMNGEGFSASDIVHFVEMNNRCDELANAGINELRNSDAEHHDPSAE